LKIISIATGALLLANGSDAADRRARFAVVSCDPPSADAVLDTDVAESSTAVAMQDSGTTNDAAVADRGGKSVSGAHLSGVRWSSCESSNGGVPEPRPRPTTGTSSLTTSMSRRGRYLAVHRYAPQNTSTGSSTSGIDVSMSSTELVWGGGGRRSAAAVAANCVGVTVVSSVDADCEDNCDDLVDDSLSLYRSSSFRRAIERGGNASPATPTAADDAADRLSDQHCLFASRFTPSLTSSARFSSATFHQQPSDPTVSHRFNADCNRVDSRELANPCVSPDDVTRAVWDVNVDANGQHAEDIDPFHCFGLSVELGYDLNNVIFWLLTTNVVYFCY